MSDQVEVRSESPVSLVERLLMKGLANTDARVIAGRSVTPTFLFALLLYGPIALPCSGPLVVSIFALSLTVGEALNTLWVFLWFGLGFGLPLLVISLLSGALQRQLTTLFARHSWAINIIGGLLLVGIALYDLSLNWEMLRLFYT